MTADELIARLEALTPAEREVEVVLDVEGEVHELAQVVVVPGHEDLLGEEIEPRIKLTP